MNALLEYIHLISIHFQPIMPALYLVLQVPIYNVHNYGIIISASIVIGFTSYNYLHTLLWLHGYGMVVTTL